MSESLKADLYGLGNIDKAFSESSDGDIVFSSHLVPQGIKLTTILGEDLTELTQVLSEIDTIYQSVLDIQVEDVYDVVGGVANFTVPISASTYYGDGSNLTGISNTFTGLHDTPSSYSGSEGYLLRVQGGDLNFVDPDSIFVSPTIISGISGNLQSQIDNNTSLITQKIDTTTVESIFSYLQSQIVSISGGGIGSVDTTTLSSLSGSLQTQIWSNDTDIAGLRTNVNTISADLASLDLTYASDSQLVSLSGSLQTQIWSNDTDISSLRTDVDAISATIGNLDFTYATDAILQSVSGAIQNQIDKLGDGYATDTELRTVSGGLQDQIYSNDSQIAGLVSISGDHATRITTLETYTGGITGGISQLDDRFVNVTGDIITGNLTLAGLSGQESILRVDTSGKIEKHDYAPYIGGKISLNSIDSVYTITDPNIKSTSSPVCTLTAPLSSATIYGINVFGVTNGQFGVSLSDTPALSGYTMSWISLEFN